MRRFEGLGIGRGGGLWVPWMGRLSLFIEYIFPCAWLGFVVSEY